MITWCLSYSYSCLVLKIQNETSSEKCIFMEVDTWVDWWLLNVLLWHTHPLPKRNNSSLKACKWSANSDDIYFKRCKEGIAYFIYLRNWTLNFLFLLFMVYVAFYHIFWNNIKNSVSGLRFWKHYYIVWQFSTRGKLGRMQSPP